MIKYYYNCKKIGFLFCTYYTYYARFCKIPSKGACVMELSLGDFTFQDGILLYTDTNKGDLSHFYGREYITVDSIVAYELRYHGGLLL